MDEPVEEPQSHPPISESLDPGHDENEEQCEEVGLRDDVGDDEEHEEGREEDDHQPGPLHEDGGVYGGDPGEVAVVEDLSEYEPSPFVKRLLTTTNYYSPIEIQVRKSIRQLHSQVEALKKKLEIEMRKRSTIERQKYQVSQENLDVKLRFLGKLERVEKELLKYREEFTRIERRNDWLESMREQFQGEADSARMAAVEYMRRTRNRKRMVEALLTWYFIAIQEKIKRIRYNALVERVRRREMVQCLSVLWQYSLRSKFKKDIRKKAFRFFAKNLKRGVFDAFCLNVRQEKRKRELLKKIMLQKGQFLARLVFTVWKEYTFQEKIKYLESTNERLLGDVETLREKGVRSLHVKIVRRTCVDSFRGWREYAKRRKFVRRTIQRVIKAQEEGTKHLIMDTWVGYTRQSRQQYQRSTMARQLFSQKLLGTVFGAWHEWAQNRAMYRNECFEDMLFDSHVALRTRVGHFIMGLRTFLLRQWFFRWRRGIERTKKYRVILRRSVLTLDTQLVRQCFQKWAHDWRNEVMDREHSHWARQHNARRVILRTFRSWQRYIAERRRTRLLSQKVVLDLQTKTLVHAFDSMGMNVEDQKQSMEQELHDLRVKHEEEYRKSETVKRAVDTVESSFHDMDSAQVKEREEWISIFKDVAREITTALSTEQSVSDQMDEIKKKILMEIQEIGAAKYADRFALRRTVEEKLRGVLSLIEEASRTQMSAERRFSRQLEVVRRRAQDGSASISDTDDYRVSVRACIRRLQDEKGEEHDRQQKQHETESKLATEKKMSILKSLSDLGEMRESLIRDHREFEKWLKEDTDRAQQDRSDAVSVTESDISTAVANADDTTSKERLETLIAETREILREEQKHGREEEDRTEMRDEEIVETDRELEAEAEERRQSEEEPLMYYDVDDPDSHVDTPVEGGASSSKPKPKGRGSGSGVSAKDGSGAGKRPDELREREGTSMKAKKPKADEEVSHKKKSLLQTEEEAQESATVAFFVRPDRMPMLEEGDNRKLELEVLRLRRKFERQEKKLRKQFADDLGTWKRRYEHAVKVLLEFEEWKREFENRSEASEQRHLDEIENLKKSWADRVNRETRIRNFYQEQLKHTEEKLHEFEDVYTKEVDHLRGLVRYYESTFGVMKVNVVTEMGRKKQREMHVSSTLGSAAGVQGRPSSREKTPEKSWKG
eukprot:TRINITY_DN3702_c0_g1_i1.p1 TRINITY_DN3702_c0_g1~~TRINITY_DN3702_c0_g1_i1.p1  ORF type:complete len:1177 (-),score=426.79 TRINITY_DN3702_c0_g1_i1:374-3904(-)